MLSEEMMPNKILGLSILRNINKRRLGNTIRFKGTKFINMYVLYFSGTICYFKRFLIVGNWLNKITRGDEIGFTAIIRY